MEGRPVGPARFQTGVPVETKEDGSPLRVADRETEQLLRSLIEGRFPGHAILGEEPGGDGTRLRSPLDHRSHRRHPHLRAQGAAPHNDWQGRPTIDGGDAFSTNGLLFEEGRTLLAPA